MPAWCKHVQGKFAQPLTRWHVRFGVLQNTKYLYRNTEYCPRHGHNDKPSKFNCLTYTKLVTVTIKSGIEYYGKWRCNFLHRIFFCTKGSVCKCFLSNSVSCLSSRCIVLLAWANFFLCRKLDFHKADVGCRMSNFYKLDVGFQQAGCQMLGF